MQQIKLVAKFIINGRLGSQNEYIKKCRLNHYLANSYKIEQQSLVYIKWVTLFLFEIENCKLVESYHLKKNL